MGDQHRVEGGGAKKQAASYNRYNLLDSSAGKEKMGAKPKKKKKNGPDGFQVWLKREPIFEIFWKLEAAQLKDQKVLAL